jgi:Na+/proline symporter/signal transduction histidine kinase
MQTYLNNLTVLDIAIVAAHLLICICIGFYHLKTIKTDNDFCTLRKNKNLPSILVCTIFATSIGGGTIIGYIDEIYKNSIVLIYVLMQPFLWIITGKIVTSGIYKFQNCTTLTQIMYNLFGRYGKIIAFWTVLIDCIGATTIQILAFGAICNYFFKIDLWHGIIIGIAVINIYSILGGLRGIIAIDVFQFLIFFLIIPASYVVTIKNASFTGNFINSISLSNYDVEFNLPIAIGLLIASLIPELSAPFMQRYLLLASNVKVLKSVFKKLFMITIPFMLSICLIAYLVIMKSINEPFSSNIIFHYIEWLPLGIKGLMISGLFAILMSTADSHMNATSTIITNDFIKHYFPILGSKGLLVVMKVIILVLSLFPFILIMYKEHLFQLMLVLRSFGTNMLIIPLAASLLGFKINKNQFISSCFFSTLFTTLTVLLFNQYPLLLTFISILGSFTGLIWNKNLYKIFVERVNGLYPLLYNIIISLLFKIKKFKCIYLTSKINKDIETKSTMLNNFSLFIFSYYFIFSLYLDNTKNLLPYLIIIGYGLVLIFMVRDILFPEKLVQKYYNMCYYICVTFCLPLVSSYLLFYYTSHSNDSHIWVINSLLTTFLLYQFLNSTTFLISMTIGFILGCILYMVEASTINIGYSVHLVFYIYLSLIFISQIIMREKEKKSVQKDKLQKEKLSMMQVFGEMIAHEIKTPISITSMQSYLFKDVLDDMEKDTANAEIHYTKEDFIMKRENYEVLKDATNMLIDISQHGLNTVDNLLTSLRGSVQNEEKGVILIGDVIQAAIKEYTLYIPELKNIKLYIIDNFKVECSFNSLKYVVINLIKNSCAHSGYNIKIEVRAENHELYFKDYGRGIKKEIIEKIFDKFFTQSKSGTGIGLSFCKVIMEDIGGSIKCESIEGKYTNFILKFPKKD